MRSGLVAFCYQSPLWCPTPGFLDDFHFPSIEDLSLEITVLYSGESIPSHLRDASGLMKLKTKIKTLINYDENHLDKNIDDSVKKIILNIDFECSPTFYFGYHCDSSTETTIDENPVLGKFLETNEDLDEGARLANRMAGYSLRVSSRGVIHHLSATGIFMVLGFFYVATLLVKEILFLFVDARDKLEKQRHNDLYVDHHLKEE